MIDQSPLQDQDGEKLVRCAQVICNKLPLDGVIIIAARGRHFCTASYGRTLHHCRQAREAADSIRDAILAGALEIAVRDSSTEGAHDAKDV